jgi:hypothetical protein
MSAHAWFCLAAPATGGTTPRTIARSPRADENFLPGPSPERSSSSTMASTASQVKKHMPHATLQGLVAAHPLLPSPPPHLPMRLPSPHARVHSLPDPPHILQRAGIVLIGCIYSGFTLIRATIPTIRLDDAAQMKKVITMGPSLRTYFARWNSSPLLHRLAEHIPPRLRPSPSPGQPLTEGITTHGRFLVCPGLFRRRSLGAAVHERERDGQPVL